jgi:hypothetical protein
VSTSIDQRPPGIDRRKLVRAGVWAVPVVSVAAATPAFAGTGCCSVTGANASANWEDGELNYIDIFVDVDNNCDTAVSGLVVTLTFCDLDDITYVGDDKYTPGWTQGGVNPNSPVTYQNGCYYLTWTYDGTLGANGSLTGVKFTVKTKAYEGSGNRPSGTVGINISGGGCSSDTSASIAAVTSD